MVFSVDEDLLTMTKKVVGWWKEYFEDILNSTNTHSKEETELGLEVGFHITGAETEGRFTPGY